MPTFISDNGIWKPAQEKAFVPATGEIYIGPDREAKKYIEENGGTVGMDIAEDPQILEIAQRLGLSVEEYLKRHAPTPVQIKAKEEADKVVNTHDSTKKKRGVRPSAGGFGDENDYLKTK